MIAKTKISLIVAVVIFGFIYFAGIYFQAQAETTPQSCSSQRNTCYDIGDKIIRDREAWKKQLVNEGKDLDDYEQELNVLWQKAAESDRTCEPQFIACCESNGLTAKKNTGRCETPKGGATTQPQAQSSEDPCKIKDFLEFDCIPKDLDRLRKFSEFRSRYLNNLPVGSAEDGGVGASPGGVAKMIAPGQANNLLYAAGAKSSMAGNYQDKGLQWLLSLYFSQDSTDKSLIEGLDFGPIQIEGGAHQAVVVYQTGTDWRTSGVVLDPWLEQKPQFYPIDEWDDLYVSSPEPSMGNIGRPAGFYKGLFATTPDDNGKWKYPNNFNTTFAVRNRANGGRRIAVASPVMALVSDNSGRSFGLHEDGTFVNDFGSDIEGHILKTPDGGYQTDVNLPDGAYEVKMTAINSGDVHVYSATGKNVSEFETVKVNKNDLLSLIWSQDDVSPRMFDNKNQEVTSRHLVATSSSKKNVLVIFVVVSIAIIGAAAFLFRKKIGILISSIKQSPK